MKKGTVFVCQNCGFEIPRWLGQCPSCKSWGSLVEEVVTQKKLGKEKRESGKAYKLSELKSNVEMRTTTGFEELNRVLGGGIVKGSLTLIGGDPGIGKSTLIMQVGNYVASKGESVLYVSAEESAEQLKLRAERLGVNTQNFYVLPEVALENILESAEKLSPPLLVIDSIQTIYKSELSSAPGSVGQVRECTADLMRFAKEQGIATFIVGHVTKFGAIAGPKTLEHIVDTVLYFEGDRFQQYRILRTTKNRFGSTNEIGIFEMTEAGLTEVSNPSQFFLAGRAEAISGSVVVSTLQGSRPVLIEVQALATPTFYSIPQRVCTGFDFRRLAMLLCIIERRGGIQTSNQDVFLNIVGGLKIEEPAADLGVVMSVISSIRNKPIAQDTAIVGEVGLGGEIRSVAQINNRIKEAVRIGFRRMVMPNQKVDEKKQGIELLACRSIQEALELAIGL
jgi:DNA repair protein RadA/Sms